MEDIIKKVIEDNQIKNINLDLYKDFFFNQSHSSYEKWTICFSLPPTSSFAPSCNPALIVPEGVPLVRQVDGLYSGREGDRGIQFDQSNVVGI